jgi:hypothetical protein
VTLTASPVEPDGAPIEAPRASGLGGVALIVAVATIVLFRLVAHIVSLWLPAPFEARTATDVTWTEWFEAAGMAVALVLGVLAVAAGRGRLHGAAAIFLALIGTSFFLRAMIALLAPPAAAVDVH